jgi:hypothetical protein
VIDGYGDTKSAPERFAAVYTLIHIGPALPVHAWCVAKWLLKGLFVAPEGWPKGSLL